MFLDSIQVGIVNHNEARQVELTRRAGLLGQYGGEPRLDSDNRSCNHKPCRKRSDHQGSEIDSTDPSVEPGEEPEQDQDESCQPRIEYLNPPSPLSPSRSRAFRLSRLTEHEDASVHQEEEQGRYQVDEEKAHASRFAELSHERPDKAQLLSHMRSCGYAVIGALYLDEVALLRRS